MGKKCLSLYDLEIVDDGIVVKDENGQETNITADCVVNTVGKKSIIPEDLFNNTQDLGKKVIVIGDAKAARKVKDAIHEGFNLAINI